MMVLLPKKPKNKFLMFEVVNLELEIVLEFFPDLLRVERD
jgi:hypothetical protein